MKPLLAILFLVSACFCKSQVQAGTIRGTIRAEVSTQGSFPGKTDNYGSRKYKFLEQVDYSRFEDFVVGIADIDAVPAMAERPRAVVEQINGSFVPRILPIVRGTVVEWPNRDEIFHNVFSISESKPFDLGYYKSKDDAKTLVFEKPGRVDVFCSIHSKMNCILLVLPNPWFAKSDKRGRFEIPDIPAGNYRLRAWHERLPPKYLEVTVPAQGIVDLDIVMGLADLPKF